MTATNKLLAALAAAVLAAGCASSKVARQDGAQSVNRYDEYDAAIKSEKSNPSATEWQNAHAKDIALATSTDELAKTAGDDPLLSALLAETKDAYATDPLVATRIAAITQLAMCPRCAKAQELRFRWTKALLEAARDANDPYAKIFLLEQLRWCAFKAQAGCVREIGKASRCPRVAEFAELVAKGLEETK